MHWECQINRLIDSRDIEKVEGDHIVTCKDGESMKQYHDISGIAIKFNVMNLIDTHM